MVVTTYQNEIIIENDSNGSPGADRSWKLRGTSEVARPVPTVERLSAVSTVPASQNWNTPSPPGEPQRGWAAALSLVEEAAEAIRLSEERVQELELEAQLQAAQMRDDLIALQAQLQAAQQEILNANARATAAEDRELETRRWLNKLDDAISDGFGRFANRKSNP